MGDYTNTCELRGGRGCLDATVFPYGLRYCSLRAPSKYGCTVGAIDINTLEFTPDEKALADAGGVVVPPVVVPPVDPGLVFGPFKSYPTPPTVNLGTVTSFGPLDIKSDSYFMEFTVGGEGNWRPFHVNGVDTNGDVFTVQYTDDGTYVYQGWGVPNNISAVGKLNPPIQRVANQTKYGVRMNKDGSVNLTVDGNIVNTLPRPTVAALQGDKKGSIIGYNLYGEHYNFPVFNFTYGSSDPALNFQSAISNTARQIEFNFKYSNLEGSPPTGYEIRIRTADGQNVISDWASAILVDNSTAGVAKVKSQAVLDASLIGRTVTADLRQKDIPANSVKASVQIPTGMIIGANMSEVKSYESRRKYANLFAGSYYQFGHDYQGQRDIQQYLDADGYNSVYDNDIYFNVARPDASGSEVEFTWDGDDVNFVSFVAEGSDQINNWRKVAPNTYRYTHVFDPNSGHGLVSIQGTQWSGNNYPHNLNAREVGMDRNIRFAPSFIAFMKQWTGPIRFMDMERTNDNQGWFYTWDQRPRRSMFSVRRTAYGMPVEDKIELCNLTQRKMWTCAPSYAPADYLQKHTLAVLTGAGTDNGVALSGKPAEEVFQEVGNEWWNNSFGLYGYAINQGLAAGHITQAQHDEGGGYEGLLIEHAYQYKKQMDIIIQAAGVHSGTITRVFATGNGDYECSSVVGKGGMTIDDFDAIAVAPYYGPQNVGSTDLAVLGAAWASDMEAAVNNSKQAKIWTQTHNKRLLGYEGGPDFPASGLDAATGTAFFRSQYMHDIYKRMLERWRDEFGDIFCCYTDTGYIADAGGGGWGVEEGQGMTFRMPKMEAFKEVQATLG